MLKKRKKINRKKDPKKGLVDQDSCRKYQISLNFRRFCQKAEKWKVRGAKIPPFLNILGGPKGYLLGPVLNT